MQYVKYDITNVFSHLLQWICLIESDINIFGYLSIHHKRQFRPESHFITVPNMRNSHVYHISVEIHNVRTVFSLKYFLYNIAYFQSFISIYFLFLIFFVKYILDYGLFQIIYFTKVF